MLNVPSNDISQGDTIASYAGSGPPQGTGLHRYVFLVFEQAGVIDTKDIPKAGSRSLTGRLKTSTSQTIEDYNLGQPKFGNYYQAQYDDYVPVLQKMLSGSA